jgi:hypothetical protein
VIWEQLFADWRFRSLHGSCSSKPVKQKEVKEGHEKAIGNQLLRALKLDGKFLCHGARA